MLFNRLLNASLHTTLKSWFSTLKKHTLRRRSQQFKSKMQENLQQKQIYEEQKKIASIPKFRSFNLLKELVDVLDLNDINTPSSIQQRSLAQLVDKFDKIKSMKQSSKTEQKYQNRTDEVHQIVGQTGTGKTLCYILPLLNCLKKQEISDNKINSIANRPQALIIVSSKELVYQVYKNLSQFSHVVKLKIQKIGYNKNYKMEREEFKKGSDIVVTTIDRLEKHRQRGSLYFSNLKYLVVDEMDTIMDAGLGPNLNQILTQVQKPHIKKIFVSSSFTGRMRRFLKQVYNDKVNRIIDDRSHYNLQNIMHEFIHMQQLDKLKPLLDLLNKVIRKGNEQEQQIMIFCNSVGSCQFLEYKLQEHGYNCVSLHGDINKKYRIQNFQRFLQKQVQIMITTDLGSRGIDIKDLKIVINFDFPETSSDYIHRAGRTGRMGQSGIVYSLYHNKNKKLINELQDSHQHDKPLKIEDSQYFKINKEQFKDKKMIRMVERPVLQGSEFLPQVKNSQQLEKNLIKNKERDTRNYIQKKSREHVQLKLIKKQQKKIRKNIKSQLSRQSRRLNMMQKRIKRKIQFEKLSKAEQQKRIKVRKNYKRKQSKIYQPPK